ncbi:hypothetical protein N7366_03650 [Aeromonas caviae]|nr:hypothetical protein [Aeromonas caviae]MDH0432401.1 hypothetical protein [Aeromonas caviae]MDH0935250.1 hypothetical protein [Aeromonas caviae]MDH1396053.1 hypothetical protein [Aeromonas caviae]MDH1803275.1 hypothetical protein [Aeromonas caviae]
MTQLEITTKILRNLPKDLTASEQITLLVISTFINLGKVRISGEILLG